MKSKITVSIIKTFSNKGIVYYAKPYFQQKDPERNHVLAIFLYLIIAYQNFY